MRVGEKKIVGGNNFILYSAETNSLIIQIEQKYNEMSFLISDFFSQISNLNINCIPSQFDVMAAVIDGTSLLLQLKLENREVQKLLWEDPHLSVLPIPIGHPQNSIKVIT